MADKQHTEINTILLEKLRRRANELGCTETEVFERKAFAASQHYQLKRGSNSSGSSALISSRSSSADSPRAPSGSSLVP